MSNVRLAVVNDWLTLKVTVLPPILLEIVGIAGHKMLIRKIGFINLMVILVMFLPLFVHKFW